VPVSQWEIVATATAVVAVVIAVLAWQRPKKPRRSRVPSFEGRLGDSKQNVKFLKFLGKHERRRVYLDLVLDEDAATVDPSGSWLAAKFFHLRIDGKDAERLGSMHDINIGVDELNDNPLTYAHGIWTLKGYFAVEGAVGFGQGILAHRLVHISLSSAAE
jgi:hypothetical protein